MQIVHKINDFLYTIFPELENFSNIEITMITKLNSIYENLRVQADDRVKVELRHFVIIDEAHYMLEFDNKPLRYLIAIVSNKVMSFNLAVQNMDA